MSQLKSGLRTALAVGLGSMLVAGAAHAQLDQALQVARQSTQEGARAQEEINDVADRAGDLEREYLALRQQIEDQRVLCRSSRKSSCVRRRTSSRRWNSSLSGWARLNVTSRRCCWKCMSG